MTYTKNMHRSGLTAIAAVLALSSIPAFAQDANGTPPVAETPATSAPAADPLAPVTTTTTTTTSETSAEPASDPLAPSTATTAAPATTRTTTSRTTTRRTASASRPARAAVARSAPTIAAPLAAPELIAPVTEPIAPMVAETAPLAPVATPPVEDNSILASDDLLPIAGAAGFGLVLLLGAGAAMRRRKRRDADGFDTVAWTEPSFAAAPIRAEPAPAVAPRKPESASAFAWAPRPAAATAPAGDLPAGVDAAKLGRHVQAAYRGPTADNPSLSLKKRIKRAAFFDQRDRLVAKGKATAVAPGAGLPDAMARQASRVRDTVTARAPRPMNYQPQNQPAWN